MLSEYCSLFRVKVTTKVRKYLKWEIVWGVETDKY